VPEAGQPHAPLLPAVSSHVLNPQRCARTRLLVTAAQHGKGSSQEPHGLASLYPEGLSSYCSQIAKTSEITKIMGDDQYRQYRQFLRDLRLQATLPDFVLIWM